MGHFHNFDIFSYDFFIAFWGQTHVAQLEGKKYQRHKKHFQTFFRIANIFVQYKGIAQCFFSTN